MIQIVKLEIATGGVVTEAGCSNWGTTDISADIADRALLPIGLFVYVEMPVDGAAALLSQITVKALIAAKPGEKGFRDEQVVIVFAQQGGDLILPRLFQFMGNNLWVTISKPLPSADKPPTQMP